MSVKSERKKKAYLEKKDIEPAAPLPMNWYAEDVKSTLDEHNQTCKDPNCTHCFAIHWPNTKTVAMLQNGETKKIFLALYGEGALHPYKPYKVLNLATGEEIAGLFDEKGRVARMFAGHADNGRPICLTLMCHHKGIDISVDQNEPDSVTLVCAEPTCRQPIRFPGFNGTAKLAPSPKTEYPNIFCSRHGIQPAYFCCKHVIDGATPLVLAHPTAEDYGIAVCGHECYQRMHDGVKHKDEFHPACAPSLVEILGDRLTNGKVTVTISKTAA